MVEVRNSGEKRRKKPIRNTPHGFKDVIKESPRETLLEKTKEKLKEEPQAVEASSKQRTEDIFSSEPKENTNNGVSSSSSSSKHHMIRSHRNKLIAVSVVAAVLLLVFVFKPNILGLGVYDQGETNGTLSNLAGASVNEEKYSMNDLGSTMEQLRLEISSGNIKLSEFLENDISRITNDLVSCLTEKSSLEDTYEESIYSLEDKLEEKTQELDALKAKENQQCSELESTFSSLQDSFDLLAINSAKSICCKQKVDNFDIDYYDVVNHKIVCLEEGNKSLNCFS